MFRPRFCCSGPSGFLGGNSPPETCSLQTCGRFSDGPIKGHGIGGLWIANHLYLSEVEGPGPTRIIEDGSKQGPETWW